MRANEMKWNGMDWMAMSTIQLAMMGSFFFHFSRNLLLFFFFFFITSSFANNENQSTPLTLKVVDIKRPILNISPSLLLGNSNTQLQCERIQVSGISRLKLGSYFNAYNISLTPSVAIPENLHNKIKVCFHKNNTLGWCQCKKDKWKGVKKGEWGAIMSPYETRYIDVQIDGELSGSVTVSLEKEQRNLGVHTLGFGLFMLLMGRDSMPMPIGVIVKWTIRAIGTSFVFQSTLDIPLALGALVFCVALCKFCTSIEATLERFRNKCSRRKRKLRDAFPMRVEPQTYSTIHNIDNRPKLTKEEWDNFTSKSTKKALRQLAASERFKDWLIQNPDRLDCISRHSNRHTKQSVAKIAASPGFIGWFSEHPDRIKIG